MLVGTEIVEESDISKNKYFFISISVFLSVDYESEIGFWRTALEIPFLLFLPDNIQSFQC